jgi:hypothetical protein
VSLEGWQAWDVALKSAGQLRVVPGAAIGLDFGVCLALAHALGYDPVAAAELLSAMEPAIIAALNARITTVANGRIIEMASTAEVESSRRCPDSIPEQGTRFR